MSESAINFFKIVVYPLITEKSVTGVELRNQVTFIVDLSASKRDISRAIREYFNVDLVKVNTMITPKGLKKAIVTFKTREGATEVAVALGII